MHTLRLERCRICWPLLYDSKTLPQGPPKEHCLHVTLSPSLRPRIGSFEKVAMNASAIRPVAEHDILRDLLRILTSKLPQLKALWKRVDQSGFEPAWRNHLVLALLRRAFFQEFTAQAHVPVPPEKQTLPRSSVPSGPRISTDAASPASSSKSFKQAVEKPPSNAQHSDNAQYEDRLAAVELAFKEHEQRLKVIDQKAEEVERESNKLSLVLYGVPEELQDKPCVDESEIAHTNLTCIVPEVVSQGKEAYLRRGRSSSKPRPLIVCFTSEEEKNLFLKHAKTFRQAGVRCDDYLTRLQQQERQVISEDFIALKVKGHKPFFRGSELEYHHADKMHTCRQSQAHKAPAAKS